MTFDDAKIGLIKALVYSVQFDNDPFDDLAIDRIIERVVKTNRTIHDISAPYYFMKAAIHPYH